MSACCHICFILGAFTIHTGSYVLQWGDLFVTRFHLT